MIACKTLLENWGRQLLKSPEYRELFPLEVVQSGWLGYPGATETEIAHAEIRLGKPLTPSYRLFLQVTNGWRETGSLAGPLWPVQSIEWFSVRHQKDFIDPWLIGYHYFDKPPRVPDDVYFVYGDEQNSFSYLIREEYFSVTLEISDIGDSAVYLLNPAIIDSDGEWEAWYFEPEIGIRRYRSFKYLLEGEYKWFLQSQDLSQT